MTCWGMAEDLLCSRALLSTYLSVNATLRWVCQCEMQAHGLGGGGQEAGTKGAGRQSARFSLLAPSHSEHGGSLITR